MDNKKKVELFNRIQELLKEETDEKRVLKCVGTLTRPQGIKGMYTCQIGHPVYEKDGKYILFMETLTGVGVETPYHKEDLNRVMSSEPVKIYE